ncbi:hypothetical protein [Curtobacterium flaccumfaciens]|uniref:hypothetical protein n=1 Tax=Curtobacterium flaccumfaciens TaxID=2035 RepID=UPI001BDEAF15|nr:hypothetical protein [Curtobacterium flaccumfaciens]MBT1632371.1 hypothetical protein [Curtobacterium flaccumfaciens pv. oortii]MCX2844989.1 hypothetical protein [Curtobacterium flaccumfaciens pv. oortii]
MTTRERLAKLEEANEHLREANEHLRDSDPVSTRLALATALSAQADVVAWATALERSLIARGVIDAE